MEPLNFDSPLEDVPLTEHLVLREGIATFESQFTQGFFTSVADEIAFLRSLPKIEGSYGAASNPVYPLLIDLEATNLFQTGRDVLNAMKAREFSSEHIASLDETTIAFPGYHPNTENDEIHNDASEQYIFYQNEPGEDAHEDDVLAWKVHTNLKEHVFQNKLWYVLLHTTPKPFDEYMFSDNVILFAVGKSSHGHYATGVVTSQVCHNLCD